jgi:hypothetical protein
LVLTPERNAAAAVNYLREAAELIREDPIRQGSLLRFGSAGQLVMTGDMHGNLKNFEKLQRFCALPRSPGRYVILHELIHADPQANDGVDLSIDLLVQAAAWKCQHPDNVFFLQSNHELSQYLGHEITKGGRSVLRDFELGVQARFGYSFTEVLEAVNDYISALPLAATTANGVFLAHSLPEPLAIENYDYSIFDRLPTMQDYQPGGPAYQLVWGRFQPPKLVDQFVQRMGMKMCVVGHTPQESGYARWENLIIIASDHSHGVFMPIDLSESYTAEELVYNIRKFVSVE